MLENSLYLSIKYYFKVNKKFNSKIKTLLVYPYMYQKIKQETEIRKMSIFNYTLLYKVHNKIIIVCRIFSNKIDYKYYISNL